LAATAQLPASTTSAREQASSRAPLWIAVWRS